MNDPLSDLRGFHRRVLQMTRITQDNNSGGRPLSDPAAAERLSLRMTKIDRFDSRGDIREHLTRDSGRSTICGLKIGFAQSQRPCGNRPCRRCEKIAAQLSEVAPSRVEETK